MKAQVKAWWVGNGSDAHENASVDHAFLIDDYYPENIDNDEIEESACSLVECAYNDGEPLRRENYVAVSVDGGLPFVVKITAIIGETLESEIMARSVIEPMIPGVW